LNRASCFVVAALAASGIDPGDAGAFPIEEVSATAVQGNELSYSTPTADAVSIDQYNQVILVRAASHIYAFVLACPHENTALR
jgi:hypothetical protein